MMFLKKILLAPGSPVVELKTRNIVGIGSNLCKLKFIGSYRCCQVEMWLLSYQHGSRIKINLLLKIVFENFDVFVSENRVISMVY